MGMVAMNWAFTSPVSTFTGENFLSVYDPRMVLPSKLHRGYKSKISAFASRKTVKKLKKDEEARKTSTLQPNKSSSGIYDGIEDKSTSKDNYIQDNNLESSIDNSIQNSTTPSRNTVLQACTVTSGLIASLGLIIRQVSHVASTEGWSILDCTEISVGFETWHLELIIGLVILISSSRYLLLKTWPDFAESSEAANQQVLSSLQPLDYIVVAFLPGISEELLFRGALLPIFGINWKSVLVVAAIFGILHLGNGRKYSFAVWATFVGFAYGCATITSSNIIVPMASHAANNLIGAILWRYSRKSS